MRVLGAGQMAQGAHAEKQVRSSLLSALPSLLVRGENLSQQDTASSWQLFLGGECLCPLSECPGMDICEQMLLKELRGLRRSHLHGQEHCTHVTEELGELLPWGRSWSDSMMISRGWRTD